MLWVKGYCTMVGLLGLRLAETMFLTVLTSPSLSMLLNTVFDFIRSMDYLARSGEFLTYEV